MLTETTITKLREMRLSVMANALKDQLEDSQYNSMAFEDRLGPVSYTHLSPHARGDKDSGIESLEDLVDFNPLPSCEGRRSIYVDYLVD